MLPKPGLSRCANEAGAAIEVELWDLPLSAVGGFLAGIPAPLGLGTLELLDGRTVHGFICEGYAIRAAVHYFVRWMAELLRIDSPPLGLTAGCRA